MPMGPKKNPLSRFPHVRPLPLDRRAVQQKPGPPPMASEILAKFKSATATTGTPATVTPQKSLPRSAQLKPAPRAYLPGTAGGLAGGLRRSAPVAPQAARTVQLFKVGPTKYSKPALGALVTAVCQNDKFSNKQAAVQERLSQYLSIYPDETFTMPSLIQYLYDDIFRQKIPLDPKKNWTAQTLFTTAAGLKRMTGPAPKQVFPANEEIRFYRTMKFTKFAEMLGIAPGGRSAEQLYTYFPEEKQNIKRLIRDTTKLGKHAGDFKQALSYFGNGADAQVMLEFTFDTNTFFNPANLALPAAGVDDLRTVLTNKFSDSVFPTANPHEGTHKDMPGVKSEARGVYSIGLSPTAMGVFITNAKSIKVVEYYIPPA